MKAYSTELSAEYAFFCIKNAVRLMLSLENTDSGEENEENL